MTGGIFSPSITFPFLSAEFTPHGQCALTLRPAPPPCPGPAVPAQKVWPPHTPASRQEPGHGVLWRMSSPALIFLQMRILSSREKSCSLLGAEVGIETKSHTF